MKTRSFTSCCLLLLALPVWGQSPPPPAGVEPVRPLNLSLPRDVLAQPSTVIRNDAEETAVRNLRQEGGGVEKRPTHQRYGTGYEARQRGMATESSTGFGGSMGSPTGGGGMGGGGRGGMGRGR
jgi:hypothetical protein